MIANNAVFTKSFRPQEVGFAKYSAEYTTYESEEDEYEVVDGFVVNAVVGFEQNQFSGPVWV